MPARKRSTSAVSTKAINKSLTRIKSKAKTALKKIIDRESAAKRKAANAIVDHAVKTARKKRDLGPLNHLSYSIRSAGSTASSTLTLPVNLVRRVTRGKRNTSQRGPFGHGTNTLAHTGGIITSLIPRGRKTRRVVRRRRRSTTMRRRM